MRTTNWANTVLGPADKWPKALLSMVGLILESHVPMYLVWGPERTFIYNDAYLPLIGPNKHPAGFGKPLLQVWPEVSGSLAVWLDQAMAGEKVIYEDQPMDLNRVEGERTSYFSFSFSPIRGDHFDIEGVLCICSETTSRVHSQMALSQSQENLRLALYGAGMGTWEVDLEAQLIEYSPEAAKIFGMTTTKFDYDTLVPYMHPEDLELINQKLGKMISEGGAFEAEYRLYRPDGELRWINSRGHCILRDGKPSKIAGVLMDITERKQAQLNFEKNVDGSPAILWITDENGACTYLSKQWYSFTGQTEVEALGFGWLKATHPDDEKAAAEAFRRANENHGPFKIEYRLRNAKGDYRWAIDTGNPRFDKDGKFIGLAGTVLDIHEVKIAQDALKESEAKFRTIADAMPQMVWSTRADGFHDYYNKRWYEFTGAPEGTTDGEGWNDMFHPDDQRRARDVWATSLATGAPYEIRYRLRYHAGGYRWTLGRALPIFDANGDIIRWMGTCTDIHDEILAADELQKARTAAETARDEAERANELKSAFLANMSHEIRTPLGAMMGFADLLRDPSTTPTERASYVDILYRNGENLSVIINDILDLSKVEAGHLTLEYVDTMPDQIGADVVSLLRVKAKEKNLVLEYTTDSTAPKSVVSDPTRVRQILMNIVGNAIKFTQFGSVHIRSFGCNTSDGRSAMCFEVKDTGIGIAQDQRENVFEMFVQADGTMTRRFGGTGLGLALSRRLAREMGGDVTLQDSQEGLGTTFLIMIADHPERRTAEETPKTETKFAADQAQQALAGLKILVVDDAPDNQHLLWRYLHKHGAIVTTVENGLVGYRTAISGDFDLVLMDIQMPVMDGYTATAKLREAGYRKPIIALTAHAMNEVRKKALNVGYTDHLTKPINSAELIATIAHYGRS